MDQDSLIGRSNLPVVLVARCPEFDIGLEQFGEHTFTHCVVHAKWTPGVKHAVTRALDTILDLHGGPLHVYCPVEDNKLRRFAAAVGFEHNTFVRTPTGAMSEIRTRKKERNGPNPGQHLRRRLIRFE